MPEHFSVSSWVPAHPCSTLRGPVPLPWLQQGDKVYIVDNGRGFYDSLAAVDQQDLDVAQFTHFHSDHIANFGELLVSRTIAGITQPLPISRKQ